MENDRLQRMFKKGKERFNELLSQSGGTISIAQASERLKVDISQIEEMIKVRKLLAVFHEGRWQLPVKQFVGTQVVPGLENALNALPPGTSDYGALSFMLTTVNGENTPLQLLLNGVDTHIVEILAAGYLMPGHG